MSQTYDVVETEGNTKVTTKYTCDAAALSYTIIGEEILNDFAFINGSIPDKLDEMLKELGNAAAITDAFYFENGTSISDINHAYEEIKKDVELLKTGLNDLSEGYKTAIANVNAELASNFGYWTASKPRVAGKVVEEIPVTEE